MTIPLLDIGDRIDVTRHGTDHAFTETYYVIQIGQAPNGTDTRYSVSKNPENKSVYSGYINHKDLVKRYVKVIRQNSLPEELFNVD